MQKLQRDIYKDFSEGLQGDTEPEKARMEIELNQKLLDKVDQQAENSEDHSSRSELVREVLRQLVKGDPE